MLRKRDHPLLKKNKDANDPASYRPVALTCCTAKLIEHVAKLRLQHFLEDSRALPPEQAGFRWGRSTTEQILRVTQDVADGLAEKQYTLMVCVDFSRYFDRVWRLALHERLLDLGVPPRAVRWVRQFLSDRRAHVRCASATSAAKVFDEGMPQGTVLVPSSASSSPRSSRARSGETTTRCRSRSTRTTSRSL